jgi:hypothetical protein
VIERVDKVRILHPHRGRVPTVWVVRVVGYELLSEVPEQAIFGEQCGKLVPKSIRCKCRREFGIFVFLQPMSLLPG